MRKLPTFYEKVTEFPKKHYSDAYINAPQNDDRFGEFVVFRQLLTKEKYEGIL